MKPLLKAFFTRDLYPMLVLAIVVFVAFYKTLSFDFSPMDEQWMIFQNETILKQPNSYKMAFIEPVCGVYYRPLHFLSFIVDYKIGKLNPYQFHLTNVLLHILNVLLLFKLLMQYGIKRPNVFWLVLIFCIHPVLLSNVAWIPGRNDLILGIFFMASMLTQNLYLRSGGILNIIVSNLSFIAALFTKETAVVFPFIFLANGYLQKGEFKTSAFKFFAPMMILLGIWLFVRMKILPEIPMQESPFLHHLVNFVKVMLIYFGKAIVPVEQSVFPTVDNASILPGIITLGLIVFIYFKAEFANKKMALFGLFIFVSNLVVPVWFMSSSDTREQYENREYISLMGMLIFVSQINVLWNGKVGKYVFIVLMPVYASMLFIRMSVYETQVNYMQQAVAQCPNNYFFRQRMGDYLIIQNDLHGAVQQYSEAIRIQPAKPIFYNNRGNIYTSLKMKNEALRDMDSAMTKSKFDPRVCLNRAVTYAKFNETDIAMRELNRLKQCCSEMVPPQAENEIRTLWTMQGFQKIAELLKTQPNNPILYANRAKLLYDFGKKKEALADKQKALSLAPDNEQLKVYLQDIIP